MENFQTSTIIGLETTNKYNIIEPTLYANPNHVELLIPAPGKEKKEEDQRQQPSSSKRRAKLETIARNFV